MNLKHNVAIYVPQCQPPKEGATLCALGLTKKLLAKLCGGYTCYQCTGGWIDPATEELVEEPVTVVRAFYNYAAATEELVVGSLITAIISFARGLCVELNQQCVAVEFDGVMHLVYPEENS